MSGQKQSDLSSLLTEVDLVVFDAVGTLIRPAPSVTDAYCASLMRHTGQLVDKRLIAEILQATLEARSADENTSTSEHEEAAFWRELVRQICPVPEVADVCFADLFQHFGMACHWQCFPDVRSVLQGLQQRGMRTAIASNFDSRLHTVCDGLPELNGLWCRIVSSEVGYRKPSPRFYEAIQHRTGIPLSRMLMVGDHVANDVLGAIRAGCRAVWLNRDGHARPSGPEQFSQITSLFSLEPGSR